MITFEDFINYGVGLFAGGMILLTGTCLIIQEFKFHIKGRGQKGKASNSPKLSLWDRLFNRYTRTVIARGQNTYYYADHRGNRVPSTEHIREWVEYKVVDRVTGSERIERKFIL